MSARAYRWGREGALLPEDLALAWGPVLAPPYAGRLSFSQFSRFFFWRTKDLSLDRGTIVSHTANVHVFPRTGRLKRAVRAVRKGDLVRLQGSLVDIDGVDDSGFHWGTSTSREDEGPSSCETIYLERLTVGERDVRVTRTSLSPHRRPCLPGQAASHLSAIFRAIRKKTTPTPMRTATCGQNRPERLVAPEDLLEAVDAPRR